MSRIVALEVENIKRLSAVSITPQGSIIELVGENEAGKTSVLDAIFWGFTGKDPAEPNPIREGQEQAVVKISTGELLITRKFKRKEDGSTAQSVTISAKDGALYPSPQKMLDDLIGELSFDPLAFSRMKPADQFETLQAFVPGLDVDTYEAAQKAAFETRTGVRRSAKSMGETAAAYMAEVGEGDIPDSPLDEDEVRALISGAGEFNKAIDARQGQRARYRNRIDNLKEDNGSRARTIEGLRAQIADIERAVVITTEEIATAEKKIEEMGDDPVPRDTKDLVAQLEAIRAKNYRVDRKKQAARALAEQSRLEEKSAALTKEMAERDAAQKKLIAEAAMPVADLGFGMNGAHRMVTYKGEPLSQASQAAKIKISVAIAAALNPKLRVIQIRDGSLIDSAGMAALEEFAEKNDLQIWVERVVAHGAAAILIEDGHIAGVEPAPKVAEAEKVKW